MYDEFERAVTGKPSRGIPVFGWILIALASLFIFGIVGVGFAAYKTASMVKREFSGEMGGELARELARVERELAVELRGVDADVASSISAALRGARTEMGESFGDEAPLYAANLLSRMGPRMDRLFRNPAAGLALLRDLGSTDSSEAALRDVLEGSLRIRTDEGGMAADLWSGEDGGSLVIRGSDGQELILDLVRSEAGGALIIQSPEGVVRLGAGSEAGPLPGWVPAPGGMPDSPDPVFSVESEDGAMGAVSWSAEESPGAVLDSYRKALFDAGFRIRQEHSARHANEVDAGFWAEHPEEDRVVFLSASREDSLTRILLGYGEKVR